ncbi:MAG TPA: deoxyribonuclease IV [Terriglobia bacterium]|nr:deoxyribonuclease IV [Terriglobia bacterium]
MPKAQKSRLRVGVHTSIAGALENATRRAGEIGCDTFQMFSANPRGWRSIDPTPLQCERFREDREARKLSPLVIHDNYLINLASADPEIRGKSVAAFRGELRRALALGADYLVTHPGSSKGSSVSQAIATCIESLKESASGLGLNGLMVLIENTAGQGCAIGRSCEEVAELVWGAGRELPVGACIDTAHLFASGYSIHAVPGLSRTVTEFEKTVGLQNVCIIHANDSKAAFNSHVDRHEHIGEGQIGAEAFGRIVCHPKLCRIPFICETPLDEPDDDKRNLAMMRELAAGSRPKSVQLLEAGSDE